ncbi:uncharacterized protein N7459_007378 [Penicillium hispanicum]|uniref:uncharacterized protein n=1 Tax=Penicillium hispanicum TaxID=1080232 RepID=UPI0025414F15|nr:uncharacterized protein N7459_007378 [Penicillium hispanicum]KAJ5578414.1 hypothetical protein N7459_007378 [Penicillium hispanicum]
MDSIPFPDQDLNATKAAPTPAFSPNNDLFLASHLQKRYTTISIPATYGRLNSGPAPGTVAGIVLGSVGGVIVILYLTFLALNPGGMARGSSSNTVDEEVVVRSGRAPSQRRSDMIEVEEYRGRRPSYRRRPSADDEHIVVEGSVSATTDSRDVIKVNEDSSGVSSASPPPPRRARSRRSGVRTVDPYDYGGGSSYVSGY